MAVDARVSGPLEIVIDGRVVRLGSGKVGELFTALVRDADQVVITTRLIEEIWPIDPPRNPVRALHMLVMRLRKVLGVPELISTEPSGYRLCVRSSGPVVEPSRVAGPSQLPLDLPDFVGRHGEVVRLTGSTDGVFVLSGPPGVGKTALAVHAAHLLRSRFPDGQLFGDLRAFALGPPVTPEQVLARFLRALGVPPADIPVRLDDQVAAYRALLADRRVLVVLDNVTADVLAPLLPGVPGCMALVTSRNDLGHVSGAHQFEVGVLDEAEARELLLAMLGAELAGAATDAVSELVELCAYLPLALRIAAANLAGRYPADVIAYVAELRGAGRIEALTVEGDRDFAVQGAFALSYRALAQDARRLFRFLGLVPGRDFSVLAAAALAGCDVASAQRMVNDLVSANLVHREGTGRYLMHDLLRMYAAGQVEPEDGAFARKRLFDFYLVGAEASTKVLSAEFHRMPLLAVEAGLPELVFATNEEALAWLDDERANLVAIVLDAERNGPHETAWVLTDQLRSYFYFHNHRVEWLTTNEAGLRAAECVTDPAGESAMRLGLGLLDWHSGRFAMALAHYERALELGRVARANLMPILTNLGIVNWELGRLDAAADVLEQALELHRSPASHYVSPAPVLFNLGGLYLDLGPLELGVRYSGQALEAARQDGLLAGQALSLGNLGEAYQLMGDLARATECMDEAISLYPQSGMSGGWLAAGSIEGRANIDLQFGRFDEVLSCAGRALELALEAAAPLVEIDARNTIGVAHTHTGRAREALEYHRTALAMSTEIGYRRGEIASLRELALAHRALGELAEALDQGLVAREKAHAGQMRVCEAPVLTELAAIYLAMGDAEQACRLAEESVVLHRITGQQLGEARALRVLGSVFRALGREQAAVEHWSTALAVFDRIGVPEADEVRQLLTG